MNLTALSALSQPVKGIQSRHACNIHDIIALDLAESSHFCFQQKPLISASAKIILATSLLRSKKFRYLQKKKINQTEKINKRPPASKHTWIHKGLHTPYKADDAIVFNILRVPNRHISRVHLQINPDASRETLCREKVGWNCTYCPFCYAIVMLPFLWAF